MKNKIQTEQHIVEKMIRLYCRHKEGNRHLCRECKELLDYAKTRLERCRFGNDKPTCKACPIHCYKPQMKERVRIVMRWAGPRMLLFHPVTALRHLLSEKFRSDICPLTKTKHKKS